MTQTISTDVYGNSIDQHTGEVYTEQPSGDLTIIGTDAVMQRYESGNLPLFLRKLEELNMDPEDKEALLSVYTGGTIRRFDDFVNRDVEVIGAAILYHGPFKAKDESIQEGYYYNVLLLNIEDENGNPIVVKSSSQSLMWHLAYAIDQKGWFLWDHPTRYRFSVGPGGDHRITNLDRFKKLRNPAKGK